MIMRISVDWRINEPHNPVCPCRRVFRQRRRGGEGHALLEPGQNQCLNDPDGAVDHDERLKVTGIVKGTYDARLTLADGRKCLAKNVRIEEGKPFAIEEKDLSDCTN